MLLFFRGVVGFALSGSHVGVTLFAEYTPSERRGICLISLSFFFSLGGVLEALLAWGILPNFSWRYVSPLSFLFSFSSLSFQLDYLSDTTIHQNTSSRLFSFSFFSFLFSLLSSLFLFHSNIVVVGYHHTNTKTPVPVRSLKLNMLRLA
eukprot:TRINITY_DN2014_c0_g1_i8.p4 TRINITY_DN2014_c0_g1~~TRINITY_DN2014_c0_g1_i8.p4  ORF type:complete len:149 (+),score=29.57 TRINITY_DN2014_c0_g1_i8:413-859(+)